MIEGKDILYDLSLLKDMSGGETEFEQEMISYFVQNAPISIGNMKNSYDKNDWVELRHVAHKFLSNVNMMGLEIVTREVDLIEDYAMNEENIEQIPALISHVQKYCDLAIDQLKKEIK